MLFAFKYVNFIGTNANFFFDLFHINIHYNVLKYAAPIGISFYTLQALSYLIDIYNEKIEASHNILKV
jgi:D-alanyl-lipoteichoic acid acyltransferase DltB (MBOAT superfamily)